MPSEEAINPYLPPEQAALPEVISDEPAPLKDPRLRGWITIAAVGLFCLTCLVGLFQPEDLSWEEPLNQTGLAFAFIILISYLCWLYRCAANTRILDPADPVGPSAAIWSHLIPILNWFGPCVVLRAVAKATFKFRPSRGMDTIVVVWWIVFVIRFVLSNWLENVAVVLIWLLSTLLTGALMSYIIFRVSRAQAAFRWSDAPEMQRPDRVQAGGPRPMAPTEAPLPPPLPSSE